MLKTFLVLGVIAILGSPTWANTATAKADASQAVSLKAVSAPTTAKADSPSKSAAPTPAKAEASIPFQGAWSGRFIGDKLGNIKVTVTEDGTAKVNCVVDSSGREFDLTGPVEESGAVTAVEKSFGPAGIKVHFTGKLTHKGTASGTWENSFFGIKGTWEATRLAAQ